MNNTPHHYPGSDLTDLDYLAAILPGRAVDVAETATPKRGIFELTVNNRKKPGKMQPVRSINCEGALYGKEGHVNLDTLELPMRDFESLSQMEIYLSSWGDYTLTWLVKE